LSEATQTFPQPKLTITSPTQDKEIMVEHSQQVNEDSEMKIIT